MTHFNSAGEALDFSTATDFASFKALMDRSATISLDGINCIMTGTDDGGVFTPSATLPTYQPEGAPEAISCNAIGFDQFGQKWAANVDNSYVWAPASF